MSRSLVMATWDDAPHLGEHEKKELYDSIPAFQRQARTKGIPQLGAGAIYPVPEEEILIDPFEIPDWFYRSYALDVGWKKTAALWLAEDRETNTVYMYSEYYKGAAEPPIHAEGIKARGKWIPGVFDPNARNRSQDDGEALLSQYLRLGLLLTQADNAVESGLLDCWTRLSTGKLKVFRGLENFLFEYRIYRRDERGHVVKQNDHLMDCMRYGVKSGLAIGAWNRKSALRRHTLGKALTEYDPMEEVNREYQQDHRRGHR